MNKTQEALKMAILQMKAYGFKYLCDYQCEDKELLEVIKVCEEALAELQEQNPVAYIYETKVNEWSTKTLSISLETFLPPDTTVTPLYTSPQCLQEHDDEGIERCAKICDEMNNEYGWGKVAANTIRLLKGKQNES